jgi:hypothetical protein
MRRRKTGRNLGCNHCGGFWPGCWCRRPLPHRDPFDRMLAAQAEVEQLVLLTADPQLAAFPCQTLW